MCSMLNLFRRNIFLGCTKLKYILLKEGQAQQVLVPQAGLSPSLIKQHDNYPISTDDICQYMIFSHLVAQTHNDKLLYFYIQYLSSNICLHCAKRRMGYNSEKVKLIILNYTWKVDCLSQVIQYFVYQKGFQNRMLMITS